MSVFQILDVPIGELSCVKIKGVTCTKHLESAMPSLDFSFDVEGKAWHGIHLCELDGLIAKLQEFRQLVIDDGREKYLTRLKDGEIRK